MADALVLKRRRFQVVSEEIPYAVDTLSISKDQKGKVQLSATSVQFKGEGWQMS